MTTTDQQSTIPTGNGTPTNPPDRDTRQRSSPHDRGTLEVAPSVVRKVAQRAADLTPGVLPSPRRMAGVGAGTRGAQAKIEGEGSSVRVALDLALRYPEPIRSLTNQVRRHVIDEVGRITGYRVESVRITVSALLPETHSRVE